MKLSKRLAAIKQFVLKDSILADIGCDHAYLPCACVLDGTCVRAYACDINEGPLQRAMNTIKETDTVNRVFPVLCAGLNDCPQEVDCVIISGMGYETIKMILENDYARLSQFKRLILQSNSDVDLLRKWLSEHAFHIIDEDIVHEGHYYQILVVETSGGQPLSDDEILFGPIMPKKAMFREYWEYRRHKLIAILNQLSDDHEKYAELNEMRQRIDKQLKTSS
mgnify:CR=1 FL=1